VEVTERGELVAVLAPPPGASPAVARLISEGPLTPAQGPRVLPTPVPQASGSPTASEALARDRADGR
jgi:hypothetical protein